ncbi:MAG TPA: hypothetical protein PLF21_03860 [Exilispira sp.]|nr:hypothetical protein [Exilispira sp.]
MKSISKKFVSIIILLIISGFFAGCAPITNEADAENFANAMIKGYFIGDTDVAKLENVSKLTTDSKNTLTLDTITIANVEESELPSKFTGSHFASDINSDFGGVSYTYDNTNLVYDDNSYFVTGTIYWAVDTSMSSTGFSGVIIGYGNLEVTKDGKTQQVSFDTKYTLDFTLSDPDNDSIFSYSLSGSFTTYINDIVVTVNSWTISFEGEMFFIA